MWQLCTSTLPTRINLGRCFNLNSNMCPFYEEVPQFDTYVLFECGFAAIVWVYLELGERTWWPGIDSWCDRLEEQ